MKKVNFEIGKINIIEMDGIDHRDYPDFVDAFVVSAEWSDTGELLTEAELNTLHEEYPDFIHEFALEYI